MTARVVKIREVRPANLPDGKYDGVWGGYVVKVSIGNANYELTTDLGIRTPAAPCLVSVDGSNVTVETVKVSQHE